MNRFEFLAGRRLRAVVTREEGDSAPLAGSAGGDDLARVRSALERLRDAADPALRRAALIALARLKGDEVERAKTRDLLVDVIRRDPGGPLAGAAAEGLEYVAEAGTIPFICASARSKDCPCRVRTSLVMSVPAVADISPELGGMLHDIQAEKQGGCSIHVSMGVVLALGESEDAPAKGVLEGTLESRTARAELRALAATALAHQGLAKRSLLVKALEDRDVEVRRSAAMGLGLLGWRAPADVEIAKIRASHPEDTPLPEAEAARIRGLEDAAASQRDALESQVFETVRRLWVHVDSDPDDFVRAMAAVSLGRIAGEAQSVLAARLLERDLRRELPGQREYDLLALALAGAPSAYESAKAALDSKGAPTTRAAAAIALGLLGDARAAGVLRDSLRTETHPTLRGYVALALGMLGDRESQVLLRGIVQNGRSDRAVAYASLGLALVGGHAEAEVIVRRLARTSDELSGANMVHSLRLLADRRSIKDLVSVAQDPASPGRIWAVAALGYAGTPGDVLPRRLAMARGFDYLLPGCGPLTSYLFEP